MVTQFDEAELCGRESPPILATLNVPRPAARVLARNLRRSISSPSRRLRIGQLGFAQIIVLLRVHILNQIIQVIGAYRLFKGRHDAPTVQDYVPQLIVRSGRTARKGLLAEQTVQAGRIFDQMQVRGIVTRRAELLIHMLAVETSLVGLDGLAARPAPRASDQADKGG